MHRRHHAYSDQALDPHSPVQLGLTGVLLGQLRSYERTLVGLARGQEEYTRWVTDLDFPIHWLNRKRVWYLPYLVHLGVAVVLGLGTGVWASERATGSA